MSFPSPLFEPTHPAGAKDLMRVSEFERETLAARPDLETEVTANGTRLAALNPSLLQDLQRFDAAQGPADGLDPMEVMAAALRHARPLLLHLHLQAGPRVVPLTVWPQAWQLQSPLSLAEWLSMRLDELRVLSVQPADRDTPHAATTSTEAPTQTLVPLRPLLWELALRGARERLLPEIAGIATYRVAPGAELGPLELTGSLRAAVGRLQQEGQPLRLIAAFADFDTNRATRLLNGLYLQAALMISRSHPIGIPGEPAGSAAPEMPPNKRFGSGPRA